jgi:flagellin-like hook-associated protein FlgL
VNQLRSYLGANQRRTEFTLQSLEAQWANTNASVSRVQDADWTAETARLA